ncbi:MAG: DeoR/GlpR family DNA-binding transcription regulator [Propionibacteriaceae bacterium]|jgi:DeoR/GlpR family transcriptional regulator of sugar metabolism|nr:DeoR/GlpR family DNA-binding transcription regulator [Propionibacteriaceae bacterium]
MSVDALMIGSRRTKQLERREAVMRAVIAEGSVRIEDLAQRFGSSLMTLHRDLDDLESRGILRKSRGVATASSTSLVDATYAYRSSRQQSEKSLLVKTALDYIEPGQSLLLDDSTTVRFISHFIHGKVPLTAITNSLPLLTDLQGIRGISLVALGGSFFNPASAFMGHSTTEQISNIRADVLLMSTPAIVDDMCFHQQQETVDIKRAMVDSAATKILLVDHTKFEKRAIHGIVHLSVFDLVIVDSFTSPEHLSRLRGQGINVVIAAN